MQVNVFQIAKRLRALSIKVVYGRRIFLSDVALWKDNIAEVLDFIVCGDEASKPSPATVPVLGLVRVVLPEVVKVIHIYDLLRDVFQLHG